MINKKATLNIGFVLALFLAGVLAIVYFGGAGKIWEVTSFLTKIPAWLWVIMIIMFVFMRWAK